MSDNDPQNPAEVKFAVEEVEAVSAPKRAFVEDAVEETPAEKLERKRDYLEGFLAQKPPVAHVGEPGGDLYEAVVDALKDIFDPEIPVNIYDLGLIYGVEVTPSHTNFLLVRPAGDDPARTEALVEYLFNEAGIVVNRTREAGLESWLRFSLGLPAQNDLLLDTVARFLENA